jgi:hypothetical protein
MVCGYFLVDFALRAFYLAEFPSLRRLGRNAYDDFLVIALWAACLGFAAFSLGARAVMARNWARRINPAGLSWPKSFPTLRILVMLAISLASMAYMLKHGLVVGNFTNSEFQRHPPSALIILLTDMLDLSWIGILIFLAIPGKKRPGLETTLVLSVAVLALGTRLAVTGGKIALIQPVLEAAIVIHYARRRLRIWEMLAIGLPTLAIAFGIVNYYRFVIVGTRGSPQGAAEVMDRASDSLQSGRGGEQHSALEQMIERDAGVDALAVVMKYTPHPFPYDYGKSLIDVPLMFVPRALWNEKPVYAPSFVFEQTYLGQPYYYRGFSSIQLIADMYRNFGIYGILGGMFLLGVFLRALYLACRPSREQPVGIFIYAALSPQIIHCLEMDAGTTLASIIRLSLLVFVSAAFLGVRRRTQLPVRIGSSFLLRRRVSSMPQTASSLYAPRL